MKNAIKISIIVPVYNMEQHISTCLDSVLSQTLKNIEIICINDGSQDSSQEIIKNYMSRDSRIVLINQENQGAAAARNAGLKISKGEFIAFMDPDDWYPENDILETLYVKATELCFSIVGGSWSEYKTDGSVITDFSKNKAKAKYSFDEDGVTFYKNYQFDYGYQRFIYNTEFLRKNNLQFPMYRRFQDPPFFVKAMVAAGKFYAMKKITYAYRVGNFKNIEWTEEKLTHLMKGLTDNLKISSEYGLADLHHRTLERLAVNYRNIYFDNAEQMSDNFQRTVLDMQNAINKNLLSQADITNNYHMFGYSLLEKMGIEAQTHFTDDNKDNYSYKPIKIENMSFTKQNGEAAKISVVLSVYNSEDYLDDCLGSLVCQTLKDFEIICVNSGTADLSNKTLKRYAENDSRFILLPQKSTEVSERNYGLSKAQGEYVIFLDSNDFFEPQMLEKAYEKAQETAADIVLFGGRKYSTTKGSYVNTHNCLNSQYVKNMPVFSLRDIPGKAVTTPTLCNKFYRRSFIENECLEFHYTSGNNDIYFSLTALFAAKHIAWVNEILVNRRTDMKTNTESESDKNPLHFYEAYMALYRELIKKGIFEENEKSFVTLTLEGCSYAVNNLKSDEAKQKLYTALSSDEFLATGILNHPRDYYQGIGNYNKIKGCGYIKLWTDKLNEKKDNSVTVIKENNCQNPLVSVIVPVYNTEEYLKDCLDSIAGQTLQNIEILCMNDGSPDNSLEILKKYAENDKRISVFSQENRGLSATRNACVRRAKGKYIHFMDSDDMLNPNALEIMYNRMEQDRLDIIFCDGSEFYAENDKNLQNILGASYYIRKNDYIGVYTGTGLMEAMQSNSEYRVSACLQMSLREFFINNNLWFIEGIIHEDNAYTYKATLNASRAGYVHQPLFLRRLRPDSIVTKPISFANIYGLFVCYVNMVNYYNDFLNANGTESAAAAKFLSNLLKNIQWKYLQLDPAERYSYLALPIYLRTLFELYIAKPCQFKERLQNSSNQRTELRQKLKISQDRNSELKQKLQAANSKNRDNNKKIKTLRQKNKELTKQTKKQQQEYKKLLKKYKNISAKYKKLEKIPGVSCLKKIYRKIKALLKK